MRPGSHGPGNDPFGAGISRASADMTPVGSPLRFIPRRSPPLPAALAISLGAMAAAVAIRGLFAGWDTAFALSVTHFPAFIVATLFAGQRWGWISLVAALATSLAMRGGVPADPAIRAGAVLYVLSGAVTVFVAATLREIVLRLDEAQAALDRSEARLQMAQNAGDVGLWDWDAESGEGFWSPALYRNLGLPISTRAGVRKLLDVVHPEDRERVLALREAHVRGETPRYEAEYRMRNKGGEWQWILSRGQAVARDAEGRALRIIGTHTDITRLKEAEAALKEARNQLEDRVRDRTAELYESNVALKVLLQKREEDKAALTEQVLANTARLIEPFLARLEQSRLSEQQQVLLDILRANITELTSPFASNFSTKLTRLTPAEIQVANLVKLGKRTKEIAEIMNLSPGTISIHRKNIRKKLELTHQKTNLQTMLSINS